MSTDRDTHFAKWASLVAQQMRERDLLDIGNRIQPLTNPPLDYDYEEVKLLLAQVVYDLVHHALLEADLDDDYYGRFGYDTRAVVNSIPDMTAWPEPPKAAE